MRHRAALVQNGYITYMPPIRPRCRVRAHRCTEPRSRELYVSELLPPDSPPPAPVYERGR